MKFEINSEIVDELTTANLIDVFRSNEAEIKNLENKSDLKSYQLEDLEYSKNLRKALRRVIKHFSTPYEWSCFKSTLL